MSKTLFGNSKTALAFAGMTIVGVVVMIGPQDGGGLLDRTIDTYTQQRETIVEEAPSFSEERSEDAALPPLDPDSGWGSTQAPVFGEFAPEVDPDETPVEAQASQRAPVSPRPAGPALRIGGPVVADFPGTLVPREDGAGGAPPPAEAAPAITSRVITVEPQ